MSHFIDEQLKIRGQEPRSYNAGSRLDVVPDRQDDFDYTIAPSEVEGADYFVPDHLCALEIGLQTQSCWICRGRQEITRTGECPNCFGDGFTWSSISSIEPEPPERIPCPVCSCALSDRAWIE